jgi:acyl-CoA thioester hydrolase
MITKTTTKRVLYAETDKMGYLYYGHYAMLYELGRSELIRDLGISYRYLEDELGVMMPVLELNCRYLRPALYDDMLTIETSIVERPTKMITFHHKIYNQDQALLNKGTVKLFFIDMTTQKRVSNPSYLSNQLDPFF